MNYKQLGATGLSVSEICLGTMTFGGELEADIWKAIGQLPQDGVDRIVKTAIDAEVNFIDTADIYNLGASERAVGQALKNLDVPRKDVVIATKFGAQTGQGRNDRGASRAHIMDAVQASLDRLQTDYIDLYQAHVFDAATPVEETLRALDDLVRQGTVRYVGVSNWSAWMVQKALDISQRAGLARFATLQAYYSLANRDSERELIPMAQDAGLGLMAWSPLAGGLLSGKYSQDDAAPEGARRAVFDFPPVDRDRLWRVLAVMREVGAAHDVSPARVGLAWLLAKPHVMSVIVGAKTPEQFEDNLAARELELSAEEIARLDEASALPKEYPGWMLELGA